ncbi:hypothetical protein Pint_23089 [Pistacia integerrima]|uniref:Uncharacterized protein n=1 Tax=Pistacia integerrima TaxID=434235 RepID=A0ACC0YN06_9ROSI|nr:hypothetical protein Pint_23089 [Pistacia integerrima]
MIANGLKEPAEGATENFVKEQSSESENRVYTFLAQGCTSFPVRGLIFEQIYASSTDNYPEESIHNTLEPRDRVARRASYWSSKGHSNPVVLETLIYKLARDLCVISEINMQPFHGIYI